MTRMRHPALLPALLVSTSIGATDDFRRDEFAKRPTPSWVRMIDQGENDASLAGYETPAGIRLEVVAREPVVINPVGMRFDEDGTPHVIEWREGTTRELVDREVRFRDGTKIVARRMVKGSLDVLKRLGDTDGDGSWDRATTVFDDLEMTSTVLFRGDWTYLASVGSVTRRRPAGLLEKPREEELIRGLCAFNQHQVSGISQSPDGWLFISSGDDDNRGEGRDGSRVGILRTGAVLRCRPDGTQLHEVARGFRNPYRDVVFDEHGNVFHMDNDQEDGSKFQGCRLVHVLDGGDYGWRLAAGAVCCRPDLERGAVSGERPGKLPVILKTGRGAPAGLAIYDGTAFPDFFRGLLIYPDVYRKLVRAYRVERDGATFRVTAELDLLRSKDELFRPCQALVGPDGGLYIVDWRTPSNGPGWLWGDTKHGRIWKLSWSGTSQTPAIPLGSPKAWADMGSASADRLFRLANGSDVPGRRRATRELVRRSERADPDEGLVGRLAEMARDTELDAGVRVEALGALCRTDFSHHIDTVRRACADEDPELARFALECIGRNATKDDADQTLISTVLDIAVNHDAARGRAAAITLGRLASLLGRHSELRRRSALALTVLYTRTRPDERYRRDGLIRALETVGADAVSLLDPLFASEDPERRELAVSALDAMRTREAARSLDRVISTTHRLDRTQLRRLLSTYRHILLEPAISTRGLARWIETHPQADPKLRLTALESIARIGANAPGTTLPIALELLDEDDAGLRRSVVDVIGEQHLVGAAKALAQRLTDPRWSLDERRAVVRALDKLRQRDLPFGRRTALGVEETLDSLVAALEDGNEPELRSDVLSLLVSLDFAKAAPHAHGLLRSTDPSEVRAAIHALGTRRAEAKRLGELWINGDIDHDHLPWLVSALERHKEKSDGGEIATLLEKLLESALMSSLDPESIRRLEKRVREKGDPLRGREVYLDSRRSQCSVCHRIEGVGAHVGPDLSRIWDTHSVYDVAESILKPSLRIKESYETWVITTRTAQVFSGLKMLDTPERVVIRDALGKDTTIRRGDIERITAAETSLMPEGLANRLSLADFVDLVAFLGDREAQEGLRGTASRIWTVGPFSRVLSKVDAPENAPDPLKITTDVRGKILQWRGVDARADGRFDLKRVFSRGKLSAYVFTWIHSPREQDVQLRVDYASRLRLLIGGETVFTSGKGGDGAPEGTALLKTRLAEGWTGVLGRVVHLEGDFHFRLRVENGEGLRFSPEKD